MARFVLSCFVLTSLRGSITKKILMVAAWVLACACASTPALAQHPVGPRGAGGGVRMRAPVAPVPRPQGFANPHGAGPHTGFRPFGVAGGFRFGQPRIHIFRPRVFFGRPFFRLGVGLGYNYLWWPTCGPSLGWGWGGVFDCSPSPYYGLAFQNYVAPLTYGIQEYFYGGADRDVVWLYQKDGKVYGVTDYWFVNGQVHFKIGGNDPTRPDEQVIPYDDLDVQKTVYVNSHRGFRVVVRDEPWENYLKDHPDLTPPELTPQP